MTLASMKWHESVTLQYAIDDYRRASIVRLVEPLVAGKRVLDMRTLTGHLATNLAVKGFDVSALDGYERAVSQTNDLARSRGIEKDIAQEWDLTGLVKRFGRTEFDSVLALDILNHVPDDEQTMKEISEITKDGGQLILLVPAFPSLLAERDKFFAHLRRYNKKELIDFINRHGFKVEQIHYWNFLALPFYFLIEKVFKKRISDRVRYRDSKNAFEALVGSILRFWYINIENRVKFPCGLSLFVIARKTN